jgi:hypothetical protein
VVFSLAAAIVLYGVFNGKTIVRRRPSSLKIKPESQLKPMSFRNHYFDETPSPKTAVRVEFIEDM